jgi:hypothetical protein
MVSTVSEEWTSWVSKCGILKNVKIANGQINSNASHNVPSPKSFRLWYTPSVAENVSLNAMKCDKIKSFVDFRVI